jgi:hypothetical protein
MSTVPLETPIADPGDSELARYRQLLKTPKVFREGFGWSTVAGVLFCGLIMMPGSIYLSLMTGGNIGTAAQWVTVILFAEIMRRSLQNPTQQELVVLLSASGAMATGGVFSQLVFRAYLASSDAVRDAGMRGALPGWWVPSPDSPAIASRNLLHHDWWLPIALLAAVAVLGFVNKWTLGYFFFRLTSDLEKLPFPMAPIEAQGAMAMAEAQDSPAGIGAPADFLSAKAVKKPPSERWRLFTTGVLIGAIFGVLQVGIPAITGLFLDHPLFLLPQPWWDTTTLTQGFLPATPTGLLLDLGAVLIGMVIPYWAVIGTLLAVAATMLTNVLLHRAGILVHWQPGMDTVNTSYSNGLDFWISFSIGTGLGIAAVSAFGAIRDMRKKWVELQARKLSSDQPLNADTFWSTPPAGRGDYPMWLALCGYILASLATIVMCFLLLPFSATLLIFLIFFAFLYNPVISYVNARLLGLTGQTVDIPFVKEASFVLSGFRGVGIWLAPIPVENYGGMAQTFRVNELTGVKFSSLFKTDLLVIPTSFLFSFLFWSFIWASGPIPSAIFPAAQVQWELQAKNNVLLYSSTFAAPGQTAHKVQDSAFMQAIHPGAIGSGFALTVSLFGILTALGAPVLLIYGILRGLGGMPHTVLLELTGALLGRWYFQKKFGPDRFLRMIPTIIAGYFTGVGLIGMATIAMRLIQSAVSNTPF